MSVGASHAEEAEAIARTLMALAARLRGGDAGPGTDDAAGGPAEPVHPGHPGGEPGSADAPAAASGSRVDPIALRRTVAGLQALRQRRLRHLGLALAGEAAWDILLALYEAMLARRELTFYQLCSMSGAYPATIRRWLTALTSLGLIELPGTPSDPGLQRARLTRKGELAMTDCLRGLTLNP